MLSADYDQLMGEVKEALASNAHSSFAIVGHTAISYDIQRFFREAGVQFRLLGVYEQGVEPARERSLLRPLEDLAMDNPSVAIIASDERKEELLWQSAPFLTPATRILMAGYGHLAYRDPVFEEVVRDSLVPSLANGYPHTLTHLYQCLQNAAKLDLDGVVAEFGIFKGGTTMILSRFIQRLGRDWPVIAFDTFCGFPPSRSVLDMYDHPGCVFSDERSVRHYLSERKVEIVSGDIAHTAARLANEHIVVAFLDTDNYTPAAAALDVIQERVVVGGAIVFDHFTGRNRFCYTLGERLAAHRLLDDSRYFHLYDTGVFFRQR